jgi:hypothetical protein
VFLIDDQFSIEALAEKYINYVANTGERGQEPGNVTGLMLEAYAKWAIERFSENTEGFRQALWESGKFVDGRVYKMDQNKALTFYNPPLPGRTQGSVLREIDAIYEFGPDKIPVLFEISYAMSRAKHIEDKRDLVRELYGAEPYSCKIRPQKTEEPVQRRRPYFSGAYNRSIIIPRHDAEFTRAMSLATGR